jgi:hypothetical protein
MNSRFIMEGSELEPSYFYLSVVVTLVELFSDMPTAQQVL